MKHRSAAPGLLQLSLAAAVLVSSAGADQAVSTAAAAGGAGQGQCRGGGCRPGDVVLLQRGRSLASLLPIGITLGQRVPVESTIRDFKADHPDFYIPGQGFSGPAFGHVTGCVQHKLGPDRKPRFEEGGSCFESSASFSQWFHDVPGVNVRENFTLEFVGTETGSFQYENTAFFPMDGRGWVEDAYGHNYWFTLEMHADFVYYGGERFRFRGDDDVWVFINGTLAIDLGGIHLSMERSVDLDDLELTRGEYATLDLFFAERQPYLSNFIMETQIDLKPVAPEGSCMVWGDPHANVFDSVGAHGVIGPSVVSVFGHGDFWIVKSPLISIQGRYEGLAWTPNSQSAAVAVAVGGAFLQGHTLIVEPLHGQITWDGKAILHSFPSEWKHKLVSANYHELNEPIDKFWLGTPIRGAEFELPLGVRLTVNRWDQHLDLMITMRPQAGGQDGHCGNFDGDDQDDTIDHIKARMELRVSLSETLFKFGVLTGEDDPREMKLEDCAGGLRAKAEAACKEKKIDTLSAAFLEACIYDICFGGFDLEAQP